MLPEAIPQPILDHHGQYRDDGRVLSSVKTEQLSTSICCSAETAKELTYNDELADDFCSGRRHGFARQGPELADCHDEVDG